MVAGICAGKVRRETASEAPERAPCVPGRQPVASRAPGPNIQCRLITFGVCYNPWCQLHVMGHGCPERLAPRAPLARSRWPSKTSTHRQPRHTASDPPPAIALPLAPPTCPAHDSRPSFSHATLPWHTTTPVPYPCTSTPPHPAPHTCAPHSNRRIQSAAPYRGSPMSASYSPGPSMAWSDPAAGGGSPRMGSGGMLPSQYSRGAGGLFAGLDPAPPVSKSDYSRSMPYHEREALEDQVRKMRVAVAGLKDQNVRGRSFSQTTAAAHHNHRLRLVLLSASTSLPVRPVSVLYRNALPVGK